MRGPIGFSDDHVRVKSWFSVFLDNISRERQDLYLFLDGNLPVFLLAGIEKSKSDFTECANASQVGISEMVRVSELKQSVTGFVVLIKNNGECFLSLFAVQHFRLALYELARAMLSQLLPSRCCQDAVARGKPPPPACGVRDLNLVRHGLFP